jgi:hypothetical protein
VYLVPELNIEAKVDMEILVVVVMENTVWLPRLEPQFLQENYQLETFKLLQHQP